MPEPILFPRLWAMPNRFTFTMVPVRTLLDEEMGDCSGWCDPFAGQFSPASWRNDINPEANAESHMDALEYLRGVDVARGVLFDPPYSPEQDKRKYGVKYAGTAGWNEYLWACKREIARLVRVGGKVICFGWDSCGVGKKHGFNLTRGLLLCHGSAHRDTIVTVEVKQ